MGGLRGLLIEVPQTLKIYASRIILYYFEYIHYDDPFQLKEGLYVLKFSNLANASLKNHLYPHVLKKKYKKSRTRHLKSSKFGERLSLTLGHVRGSSRS